MHPEEQREVVWPCRDLNPLQQMLLLCSLLLNSWVSYTNSTLGPEAVSKEKIMCFLETRFKQYLEESTQIPSRVIWACFSYLLRVFKKSIKLLAKLLLIMEKSSQNLKTSPIEMPQKCNRFYCNHETAVYKYLKSLKIVFLTLPFTGSWTQH